MNISKQTGWIIGIVIAASILVISIFAFTSQGDETYEVPQSLTVVDYMFKNFENEDKGWICDEYSKDPQGTTMDFILAYRAHGFSEVDPAELSEYFEHTCESMFPSN